MGIFDDVKQVGSGVAGVAKGVANVASGVVKGELDVVKGAAHLAGSAIHNVTNFARGSENHAGSSSNTPNHQGVSHAPNAGPAMQGHIGTPPRPYTENNLGSTQSTQMISGPAGAGRKVQTSTVKGPSASDMAKIATNAKAKK